MFGIFFCWVSFIAIIGPETVGPLRAEKIKIPVTECISSLSVGFFLCVHIACVLTHNCYVQANICVHACTGVYSCPQLHRMGYLERELGMDGKNGRDEIETMTTYC